ncbi:MAG: hypothetical protein U0792_17950 [Gemmataceae bacterium]
MLTDRSAEVRPAEQSRSASDNQPVSADLRDHLGGGGRDDNPAAALTVIGQAFRLLRNLHRRCNWSVPPDQRKNRSVRDEYTKYLRKFDAIAGGVWGSHWAEDCWAAPGIKQVGSGPTARVNPIWVVEKLMSMTFPMLLESFTVIFTPATSF